VRWAVGLSALVGGVIAAAGVIAFAGNDSEGGRSPGAFRGSEAPPGILIPGFRLRSYRGQWVNERSFRGRVVVVTFLETRCTEACPIIAREIADSLSLLDRSQRRAVAALAISTHPRDDTPLSARAFLRRHRAAGKLDYLIGSTKELRPIWSAFHVLSALDSGEANTHSASVRIYDRRGEWVSTLHAGVDLEPANLAYDIVAAERRPPR
jgi:cytochrome oxidase Cu insertion factor (SCO1/SenC/PrrC family)